MPFTSSIIEMKVNESDNNFNVSGPMYVGEKIEYKLEVNRWCW